ncbi:MAG: mechanosensitive ion channel [Halioglobus sp.]
MLQTLIWSYLPLLVTLILSVVVLGAAHYLLLMRHKDLGSEARLPRQLTLLFLTVLSILLMIIVSPIPESTRNQVLGLLGIVLSGVIALSAAPFVTNFMATVMLRVTQPFTTGDFIRVGELSGKVSERGLFDTEIQTENRELIAIPNATFIAQSVTVLRKSGAIISANVSLGYEQSYRQAEPLMLEAAAKAGLSDPYVHIVALGDFSVSYRVCGLLSDVQGFLTAHSELNRQLLNTLHEADIEIASPTITRHITQSEETRLIPQQEAATRQAQRVKAEEIVFDKARDIEQLEQARDELKQQIGELRNAKGEEAKTRESLEQSLSATEETLKQLRESS